MGSGTHLRMKRLKKNDHVAFRVPNKGWKRARLLDKPLKGLEPCYMVKVLLIDDGVELDDMVDGTKNSIMQAIPPQIGTERPQSVIIR